MAASLPRHAQARVEPTRLLRVSKTCEPLRYNAVRFIAIVETHPLLWRRDDEYFHNPMLREEAWRTVARKMYPWYENISYVDKERIVKLLKKRWKHARDNFCRARRKRKTNNATRVYRYERELLFLAANDDLAGYCSEEDDIPIYLPPKLAMRRHSPLCDSASHRDLAAPQVSAVKCEMEASSTTQEAAMGRGSFKAEPPFKQEWSDTEQEVPAAASDCGDAADADQAFFDSIKPFMRKMDLHRKLSFQIGVLKLLRQKFGRRRQLDAEDSDARPRIE